MRRAFLFPGQGSQFSGMAKDLYEGSSKARKMLEDANDILGFRITDIMFGGEATELQATSVTQPAVFLHSVVLAACLEDFSPDMAAGHSLGEFSALCACGALSFEDGLKLVSARAFAMQKACELNPGTMAAAIGLSDSETDAVCREVSSTLGKDGAVVAANYNSPGQVVISGELKAVELACNLLKERGAKRALPLKVGGAFHSPCMEPARAELAKAIEQTGFHSPVCPIYQNVSALASTDPELIKTNLLKQLTSPVRWCETVLNMISDGASDFTELGPGTVLQGLVKRIAPADSVSVCSKASIYPQQTQV